MPQVQSTHVQAQPWGSETAVISTLQCVIRVGFKGEVSLDLGPEDGHSGHYLAGCLGKLVSPGKCFM